jgi:pilus assembly protein Flp/PilA
MITNFMMYLSSMVENKKGQGMVEYVLIIVVIALVVVLAMPTLTTAIATAFTNIAADLN